MARIYVSSTYSDLVDERAAVCRTLRQLQHDVMSMEDYGASDDRPLDRCLADVRACDAYVGVFAWRYGFVPPGEDLSITALELREAERSSKPCLLFLLADVAPWPRNRMDADVGAIEALRAAVQRDHVVAFFTTGDDLARAVGVAVTNAVGSSESDGPESDPSWLAFYRDGMRRSTAELARQIQFCVLASCGLLVAGGGVFIAGWFAMGNHAVGMGGTLMSAATVFPMALMLTTRRKKAVLDGYEHALRQEPPPREVVVAVSRYLNRQLEG